MFLFHRPSNYTTNKVDKPEINSGIKNKERERGTDREREREREFNIKKENKIARDRIRHIRERKIFALP